MGKTIRTPSEPKAKFTGSYKNERMYLCTFTHTVRQTQTDTHTHTLRQRRTDTYTHSQTQTDRHRHPNIHTPAKVGSSWFSMLTRKTPGSLFHKRHSPEIEENRVIFSQPSESLMTLDTHPKFTGELFYSILSIFWIMMQT